MGIIKSFKRGLKPFTNIRGWSDYDRVKSNTKNLSDSIRDTFSPKKARYPETFEQACERFHLTEKDITQRRRQYMLLTIVQLLLGVGIFVYAIDLLMSKSLPGGIASVALGFVMLTMAMRNHFWYFQIKKRKLGCTLKEYFYEGLLGVKK